MLVRYSYRRNAPDEELAIYLSHLRQCNPEVLLEDLLACAAFDATENLAHLTLPTLILCGQEDRMTPPAMSQALHAAIHGSELIVVPDAGHNVMVEHPDLVAGYLAQFIDRIADDPSPNLVISS
jgi:pimeloyl-ACP methyl ester carboxylesterase